MGLEVVAPLPTASVSRTALSSEVAVRTDIGGSTTSADRTTWVTVVTSTFAGAGVRTPLALASAEIFSSVTVGGDVEAASFGAGGSGSDWRFD